MTHKERVLAAINHEEPDRVPLSASYTPEAEQKLIDHLGVRPQATGFFKQAVSDLALRMDHDLFVTWVGPCLGYYASDAPEYTDEWGIRWRWVHHTSAGSYTEMVRHPLAELRDPADFEMPDFSGDARYDTARQVIAEYGKEYAIFGGACCTLFELSWYLRGLERVLEDLVTNQGFMHGYLDRLLHWIESAGIRLVEMGVDVLWIGDDFGAQDELIISPALFREFFKPRYAKLFSRWKQMNPALKIAFHSDGNIYPLIGDFIEIGLDILNPVQPKSMDPARLKKEFGQHLTFWGTIDIQETMPFGTPEDVANEVKLRLRSVGKGGGLILAPAHNIQSNFPVENVLAFYETARQFGVYPIERP